MTETQIYTWIFLSLSEEPASLSDIIASADVINHVIPTNQELQRAFDWLDSRGLARAEGTKHAYTEEGAKFRNRYIGPKLTIRESWSVIENQFDKMVSKK